MSETCATCRFFRMHPKADETWHNGDCRLKPPYSGQYWPTPPKDGWCGEHQPREVEPEKPKAREPGWYWTRYRHEAQWLPTHFDGEIWRYEEVGQIYRDEHFAQIGPRLDPPA